MKTLFSIFVSLLIAASSIALAMNAQQQDPLCTATGHEGYTYPEGQTPPPGSSPGNLPPNMHSAGIFGQNFDCPTNDKKVCHWVYNETEAKWVPCEGELRVIPN